MKTKRLIAALLPAMALTSNFASARQIEPREALDLISRSKVAIPTRSTSAKLVYTEKYNGLNVAYVFSNGKDGFVVAAADDILPSVLGYSSSSGFNPADIPIPLKGWLQGYGRQLQYGIDNNLTYIPPTRSEDFASVAPLCSTKWNQDAPYSDKCPKIGKETAPTGCTATAVAQVMKKYNWPDVGEGSHSYKCSEVKTTLTFDFGATTFAWNDMLDTYSGNYTDTQADAVATLMAAVGNAACMEYDDDASGAYLYDALYGLVNYLKYDKGGYIAEREYYPKTQWEEMIYSELKANRPVVYSGYNHDAGHTFVVDGYSQDGYFHLNWGWSGLSDGYFLLTALDPHQQGIGGSSSGYNSYQSAIIGLRPRQEGSFYQHSISQGGSFTSQKAEYSASESIKFKSDLRGLSYFDPFTLDSISVTMGILLSPTSGGQSKFYPAAVVEVNPCYGSYASAKTIGSFSLPVASLPTEGSYKARAAYQIGDVISECLVSTGYSPYVNIEMSAAGAKISPVSVERTLSATDLKLGFPIYADCDTYLTAKVSNSGEEYYGEIYAYLIDSNGQAFAYLEGPCVDITDGETVDIRIEGEFDCFDKKADLTPGTYTIVLYDADGNAIQMTPLEVTVGVPPVGTPKVNITYKPIGTNQGKGTRNDPYLVDDTFPVAFTVNATSGLFNYDVYVYAFYYDTNDYAYDYGLANATVMSAPGYPSENEFKLNTGVLDLNRLAFVQAYAFATGSSNKDFGWCGPEIYVKRTTSGIEGLSADKWGIYPNPATDNVTVEADSSIGSIDIFSVSGTKVKSLKSLQGNSVSISVEDLASGHYILVVGTTTGTKNMRLIKK